MSCSADGGVLAIGAKYEASCGVGLDADPWDNQCEYSGAVYVQQLDE